MPKKRLKLKRRLPEQTEYWLDRDLLAREKMLDTSIDSAEKRLAMALKESRKHVINEMMSLYNIIMLEAADGSLLLSHLYRFDRFFELQNSLTEELARLREEETAVFRNDLRELYERVSVAIGEKYGDIPSFSNTYDRQTAEGVINAVWCADGKSWSDRLWTNTELLKSDLVQGLIDCCAGGQSGDRLKRLLMDRFDQEYANADRLVRTEMSHVYNGAAIDRYEKAGAEKYRYLTAVNEVCADCRALNWHTFKTSEAAIGINMPPMHPNCRCTVIAVTELDDKGRNSAT